MSPQFRAVAPLGTKRRGPQIMNVVCGVFETKGPDVRFESDLILFIL